MYKTYYISQDPLDLETALAKINSEGGTYIDAISMKYEIAIIYTIEE